MEEVIFLLHRYSSFYFYYGDTIKKVDSAVRYYLKRGTPINLSINPFYLFQTTSSTLKPYQFGNTTFIYSPSLVVVLHLPLLLHFLLF